MTNGVRLRPLMPGHGALGKAGCAIAAALLIIGLSRSAVVADCGGRVISGDIADYRGLTFTGTIAQITPSTMTSRWRITFDVDRVFRGRLGQRVTVRDSGADCGALRPEALRSGERVLVSKRRAVSTASLLE